MPRSSRYRFTSSVAVSFLILGGCSQGDEVASETDTSSETEGVSTTSEVTGDTSDSEGTEGTENTGDTDATGETDDGEPIIGSFEPLDILDSGEIYDIFSPRSGLVFFATSSGVLRLVDGVLSEVDLGCECIVRAFDRESGFALGTEGPPDANDRYEIYAGRFNGAEGYTPFSWGTGRLARMPRRVWGDGSAFVYTSTDGLLARYHPTAILGGPSFGSPTPWGDAVADIGSFEAIWGRGPTSYYVAGRTGVYRRVSDTFKKVFTEAYMGSGRIRDLWGRDETVSLLARDGIFVSEGHGPAELKTAIEYDQAKETLIRAWFSDEPWVLGVHFLGGYGTDAEPHRYSAFLVHQTDGEVRRIDFPEERELRLLSVNEAEIYVAGPGPVAYRCRFPGCDLPSAVPAE